MLWIDTRIAGLITQKLGDCETQIIKVLHCVPPVPASAYTGNTDAFFVIKSEISNLNWWLTCITITFHSLLDFTTCQLTTLSAQVNSIKELQAYHWLWHRTFLIKQHSRVHTWVKKKMCCGIKNDIFQNDKKRNNYKYESFHTNKKVKCVKKLAFWYLK